MEQIKVTDFMEEFVEALTKQLESDYERWGDTWLERTKLGQEHRVYEVFDKYFDEWDEKGTPIPWLKVVGNAMIAWIRENHPELFSK
jgi:hypothetical protein